MAVMGLSDFSAVLNVIYSGDISENFRRDAVLPNLLNVVHEANASCLWDVKLAARNTAAAKAQGYDVLSTDFSNDVELQASLAWAHYEAYASITGTAQRIAAANGRYSGGMDKLGQQLQDAADELTVKLSTDSYAGDYTASPVQLAGIAQAIDSSGTYAAIVPGTYPTWASAENTNALAGLTVQVLRTKLLRPYYDATGRDAGFVLCKGDAYDAVKALADDLKTLPVSTVRGADGKQIDIAALGFHGVYVDGVPFIEDRHCTSGVMYATDARNLEYAQVPPNWTSMDPGHLQGMLKALTGKSVPVSEIEAMLRVASQRLTVQINALAKIGDSTRLQIVLDAQLRLKKRAKAAKLTLT